MRCFSYGDIVATTKGIAEGATVEVDIRLVYLRLIDIGQKGKMVVI